MGSWEGRLVRLGFADPQRAGRMRGELSAADIRSPLATEQLIQTLCESADPDLALKRLCGMVESLHRHEYDAAAFARTLDMDEAFRRRLVYVLGASDAPGRHLGVHPRHCYDLADPSLACARPSVEDAAAKLAIAIDAENPVDAL